MARSGFEDLEVYRLAEDLAGEVWQAVVKWDAFARQTVGWQMARQPSDNH